jgi:drug/metabolite transporter (DMT)-like permease
MNDGGPADGSGREGLALAAVAVAVGTWCASNVVIKLTSVSGLVTSFYRLWLAVAFLWPLAALTPVVRRGLDRSWLRASVIGGSLFGLHQILFFTALKMTSVINVGIIGALQPVIVLMVAGRMFGEEATMRTVAWALIAVGGTAMVVLGAAGSPSWSPVGDLIAVLNLFAFTAYFLYSKRIRAGVGATAYVVGMTTMAGLVLLAASLVTHQDLASPQPSDWPILVFLAVVSGTLGHFLTNWAHRHTSAFVMSIMMLAVPVGSSTGAVIVLGEHLAPVQIAGGAIVLLAIAVVIRSTRAEVAEELAESAAETGAP